MRFHHLAVTAFGPFAGTEVVDFDELNDAGIFLLTGPTGAGKTSILDAICFALYGVVPGDRGVKTLRSHHAAPGTRPQVVLEVTIGERRLRIARSPEWHRPKKRGDGETKENASASLTDLTGGTHRLVSSRIQEVGHELSLLLGMTSEQFMQVVILPQGQFQTFLRATSDERQSVLQRLFATHRFAHIEEWMRDRTKELGAMADQRERRLTQLLATLADRSATELPDSLAAERLGDVAERARSWTTMLVDRAHAEHERALHRERTSLKQLAEAEAADREADRLAAAARRRLAAETTLAELHRTEPQYAADVAALERHGRAALVRPQLLPLQALERARDEAEARSELAVRRLDTLPDQLRPASADCAGCESAQAALADRLGMLRAVLPRETALAEACSSRAAAENELTGLRERFTSTSHRAAELPVLRRDVAARLDSARVSAATLPSARAVLEAARLRHRAASSTAAARVEQERLQALATEARDRTADARERHLDVIERRLAGIAAELAGQLADGTPCQVCGSEEHPRPALAFADAVTEADQRAAQSAYEQFRAEGDLLAAELERAGRALHELEAQSGGLTPDEAAADLAGCRRALAVAQDAAATLPGLEAEIAGLDTEQLGVTGLLQETQGLLGARQAEVEGLSGTIERLEAELAAALGGAPGPVSEVIDTHERAVGVLEDALKALQALDLATERHGDALTRAARTAAEHGFGSGAEAGRALLAPVTVDRLQHEERMRDDRRREALAVLQDEEVQRLAAHPSPDVEQVRAALATAKESARRCSAEVGSAERTRSALAALAEQLDSALLAWEPAREEHETAERMSKLVRGMGADNQLQMRLSSYVLATRLDQVLDAANERLAQMRDQRYALRRTARARGGTRAGLGLEVLDGWTGEVRDPCTLSGGETFVVSLALALGLADVVVAESGGLRVDTLFIDEGFGMLDPDTLDDVMDRIDALRAGGRTVGVVSHVSELRGRIPTQLHVARERAGSTVEVRTLVT
jgi:exonuclease SbcC